MPGGEPTPRSALGIFAPGKAPGIFDDACRMLRRFVSVASTTQVVEVGDGSLTLPHSKVGNGGIKPVTIISQ